MQELHFDINFHTAFRVASGNASPGVDAGINEHDPLPGSSLKGVMRATGRDLGIAPAALEQVFGAESAGSPWAWNGAEFTEMTREPRVRISIDQDVARQGSLMINEECWADSATFVVEQIGMIDPADLDRHLDVLHACAAGTWFLGADRTRGLGWVTITLREAPKVELVDRIVRLREEAAA